MATPTSTAPASHTSSRRATGPPPTAPQGGSPSPPVRAADADDEDDDGEEEEEDPQRECDEDLGCREGGVGRVAIGAAVPVLVELVLTQADSGGRDEQPDHQHDDRIEIVRHTHPVAQLGDVPQEPVDD